MFQILLCSLGFGSLIISTFGQENSEIVALPYSVCTWKGGWYGEDITCEYNELAVASCGSGREADCTMPDSSAAYDMILCCTQAEEYVYENCYTQYAWWGEYVDCSQSNGVYTQVVESVCGSGEHEDCDGYFNKVTCCDGVYESGKGRLNSKSTDMCYWLYGNYGTLLQCYENNEAIFGRCGSGENADCGGYWSAILCCPFERV